MPSHDVQICCIITAPPLRAKYRRKVAVGNYNRNLIVLLTLFSCSEGVPARSDHQGEPAAKTPPRLSKRLLASFLAVESDQPCSELDKLAADLRIVLVVQDNHKARDAARSFADDTVVVGRIEIRQGGPCSSARSNGSRPLSERQRLWLGRDARLVGLRVRDRTARSSVRQVGPHRRDPMTMQGTYIAVPAAKSSPER
jgi:hypothetical protein